MPTASLGLCLILCSTLGGYMDGLVQDEVGFDGAVTVAHVEEKEDFGCVTVNIPYLDVHGKPKMGQGRLFVRKQEVDAKEPIPAFCHVHYEKDLDGAKTWCRRGWAVATAHYGDAKNGEYPLDVFVGDSYNLAKALIQWVRRLPFIDHERLHIDGGSAGGYMALAMSAEMFPVTSTTADVPVVNMAYNLNYIDANKPASKYPVDIKDSPLPVLCAVTKLADWAREVFNCGYDSDTWYYLSPISYLERITAPTMILSATGDMLVPHEQMSRKYPRPFDTNVFPQGYVRDFDTLTLCQKAKVCFDEIVPEEELSVHVIPMPEGGLHEYTLGNFLKTEEEPKGPPDIDRPWSKEKQWSWVLLDEGPPQPWSSHSRHKWSTSPGSFVKYYGETKPAIELLTAPKLERLLRRYTGETNEQALLTDGTPVNRRNHEVLEKLDVVDGLCEYAALGFEYERHMQELYRESGVQPFGDEIKKRVLEKERKELRRQLEAGAPRGKTTKKDAA